MSQGSRPERIGDQLRAELSDVLARHVKDPGIGFITLTHVKVSPDLQIARVYYTMMGDAAARKNTEKALKRVIPFLRRHIAQRLRLRRVPELTFFYDQSIEHQDRVERLLQEIHAAEQPAQEGDDGPDKPDAG